MNRDRRNLCSYSIHTSGSDNPQPSIDLLRRSGWVQISIDRLDLTYFGTPEACREFLEGLSAKIGSALDDIKEGARNA